MMDIFLMWELKSTLGTKQSWLRFKLLPSHYSQMGNLVSVRAQIWAAHAGTRGRSRSLVIPVPPSTSDPSQGYVLGTGSRGGALASLVYSSRATSGCDHLWRQEIPRHASLPASPPFFSQFFVGMQNLSHAQIDGIEIFFPKNIFTRAREKSQLESAFSASVRTLFWVRCSESTLKNNRLSVTGAFL